MGDRLRDYAPWWRFVLLILIWATTAWHFKVFMDLSIRGVILSSLFFIANILVFVGLRTRASMALLGLTILVNGLIFQTPLTLMIGVVALASAALPIGATLSLDRYLALPAEPLPYHPSGAWRRQLPEPAKIALFAAAVLFIIGGPVYNQVLHHSSRRFLMWDMFHTIGENLVMVRFFVARDGGEQPLDYLKVLGVKPRFGGELRRNARHREMRIVGRKQLADVIGRVCAAVPAPAALRLEARIATINTGWQPIYDGTEPICAAEGSPIAPTRPRKARPETAYAQ